MLLRELPKYECLLECAKRYPDLDPTSCESLLTLLYVSTDISEAFERFLSSRTISRSRFTVLMLLNRHPDQPANPADLAERAGVARATMTGLIDGLERDQLVLREPDPIDRRMMVVRLTDKGRSLLDSMLPDYFRRVSALMSHLSAEQRKSLVSLLGLIQLGIPGIHESQAKAASA